MPTAYNLYLAPINEHSNTTITAPLSANQGKELYDMIQNIDNKISIMNVSSDDLNTIKEILNNNTTGISSKADKSEVNNIRSELTNLKSTVNGKADSSELSTVKTELSTLKSQVNNLPTTSVISNLQNQINSKANLLTVEDLIRTVDTKANNNDLITTNNNLSSLTTTVNNLDTIVKFDKSSTMNYTSNTGKMYCYSRFTSGRTILEGAQFVTFNANRTSITGEITYPITFTECSVLSNISIIYNSNEIGTGRTLTSATADSFRVLLSVNNSNNNGFGYTAFNITNTPFSTVHYGIIYYHVNGWIENT